MIEQGSECNVVASLVHWEPCVYSCRFTSWLCARKIKKKDASGTNCGVSCINPNTYIGLRYSTSDEEMSPEKGKTPVGAAAPGVSDSRTVWEKDLINWIH